MASDSDALAAFSKLKFIVKHTRSCGTIKKTCVWTSLGRILWQRKTRRSPVRRMGKVSGWECLLAFAS